MQPVQLMTTDRKRPPLKLVPVHALEERVRHQGVGTLATQALALLGLDFVGGFTRHA